MSPHVYTAPSAVTTAVCDPPADTDTTFRPCGWMAAGREEVSDDVIEGVTTGWMDEVAVSHLGDARHGLKRLRAHPESRGPRPSPPCPSLPKSPLPHDTTRVDTPRVNTDHGRDDDDDAQLRGKAFDAVSASRAVGPEHGDRGTRVSIARRADLAALVARVMSPAPRSAPAE